MNRRMNRPMDLSTLPRDRMTDALERLRLDGLWRDCVALESPSGPHIQIGGKRYLHLCSNNYLDLAAESVRWFTGTDSRQRESNSSQ